MDKHTQTFNFSSHVISDTKGIWFCKLLTTSNIVISALNVYKHAAETGLSKNTLRKEINSMTKQTRKEVSQKLLPNQHAHQPSSGSESVNTTQGIILGFVRFKTAVTHQYNLIWKHWLKMTDHFGKAQQCCTVLS